VVGAGPAGLIAAEVLGRHGVDVTVYDRMPSVGRKFLMAGRGGLNLTHSEPIERFLDRYGDARGRLTPAIDAFSPADLRAWCHDLGIETFVGSSGRVFPTTMKASPLLRAWLKRLESFGVRIMLRSRFHGFNPAGHLLIAGEGEAPQAVPARSVLLALGGASWPKLGSDGRWAGDLIRQGVPVYPLLPANCGVEIAWSDFLRERHAGQPLKRIALTVAGRTVRGEAMVTAEGLEGGVVYAQSAAIRDALARSASVRITLDLRPDLTERELYLHLLRPRGRASLVNHLRKTAGLPPVSVALLHEVGGTPLPSDPMMLAGLIKSVPLTVTGHRPIERAISSAGGVAWEGVDAHFMLRALPGVFVAGEMLDWEAPTGGYLLQGCFSTGVAAAHGILRWLAQEPSASASAALVK
jgi:hypothetical protein